MVKMCFNVLNFGIRAVIFWVIKLLGTQLTF
jgi:hypothetical protein